MLMNGHEKIKVNNILVNAIENKTNVTKVLEELKTIKELEMSSTKEKILKNSLNELLAMDYRLTKTLVIHNLTESSTSHTNENYSLPNRMTSTNLDFSSKYLKVLRLLCGNFDCFKESPNPEARLFSQSAYNYLDDIDKEEMASKIKQYFKTVTGRSVKDEESKNIDTFTKEYRIKKQNSEGRILIPFQKSEWLVNTFPESGPNGTSVSVHIALDLKVPNDQPKVHYLSYVDKNGLKFYKEFLTQEECFNTIEQLDTDDKYDAILDHEYGQVEQFGSVNINYNEDEDKIFSISQIAKDE